MAKSIKKIQEVKPLDLIIEIVDARAINSSRNNELIKLFNKPKLTIALKEDLADLNNFNVPDDVMVMSINDINFKQKLMFQLNSFFKTKIENLKQKGLLIPQFYIMVIGLPNVGKSSFINAITSFNTKTNVQNKPGLTRKLQMVKISDNFFVYDTPGIMVKKVDSDEQGYKLSLINTIKREILPIDEVTKWAFDFYISNYPRLINNLVPTPLYAKYEDFIESICREFNFIKNGNEMDKQRAKEYFFTMLVSSKLGRVNYDR